MKARLYNNSILKMRNPQGKKILGWFPNHYEHSGTIDLNRLSRMRKEDKALIILENEKGDALLIEVDGFHNGLEWSDNKSKALRQLIIDEATKSKFYLEG